MNDVRQILEGSRRGFDTLVAAIAERHDAELLRRAWAIRGEGVTVTMTRFDPIPQAPTGVSGVEAGILRRVWWRKPDRWRAEVYAGGQLAAVNVCRGATASSYGADARLMSTNDPAVPARRQWPLSRRPTFGLPTLESELGQIPLFRPPFAQAGWDVSIIDGEPEFLGRRVVNLAAHRSRPELSGGDLRWDDFTDVLAVIDTERGLALRLIGILEGQEAVAYAVESIRFDEPIPDEVFDFEPPAGTVVVQASAAARGSRTSRSRWLPW